MHELRTIQEREKEASENIKIKWALCQEKCSDDVPIFQISNKLHVMLLSVFRSRYVIESPVYLPKHRCFEFSRLGSCRDT